MSRCAIAIAAVLGIGLPATAGAQPASQPAASQPASQPAGESTSQPATQPATQPAPLPATRPAPEPPVKVADKAPEPAIKRFEDLSLEALLQPIIGASRYAQKQADAPSAVTVVSADEIARYGYRTMGEILASLRGVFTTDDRNYTYVGVRGFGIPGDYNTRLLVLIDGQRANDNLYASTGLGGSFLLDVDSIERVEFIRGPSSSVYGSNAFFGVVNVITKTGATHRGPAASAEVGSLGSYRVGLRYGDQFAKLHRHGPLEVFASATYARRHGQRFLYYREFDAPEMGGGIVRDLDGEERGNLLASVSFAGLSLSGAFSTRHREVPTAAFGTVFGDDRFYTLDQWGYLALSYRKKVHGVTINARTSFNAYYYDGEYPYDYREDPADPPALTINRDEAVGLWWGAELHISRRFFDQLKVSLGAELRHSFRQDQRNFDVDPRWDYLDLSDSTKLFGLYGQLDWRYWKQLALSAGLRYDNYFGDIGGTVNPRLAAIVKPVSGTTAKLLFGTAFRAPSAYERFYEFGDPAVGDANVRNLDLKSEKIQTYEVVLEQALGRYAQIALSGYYYRIDDLILVRAIDDLNNQSFDNLGEVDALGLELELGARWRDIDGRVSYALQRAENRDSEQLLENSPRHLLKANLSVPLLADKLYASAWARYMSSRLQVAGGRTDGFFLLDLTLLARDLRPGLTISATVKNLLDTRYFDPAGTEHAQGQIEQDRRTFWLKVGYQLPI